jgi:purine nucleosidase
LVLGSPEKIDVRAIISTFGNVGLSQTRNNLLKILGFFEKVPLIGSGSSAPLKGRALEARHVHGKDGLGDFSCSFRKKYKRGFKNGIDLIIRLALSNKIDKIAATGPATDLARAIKKTPALLKNLEEVVIMGGAVFVKGNVTPYAEFNFHCDPDAAKIVLGANVSKRLISLDVTHKTLLTQKHLKPLENINSPVARFISSIAGYSIKSNKKRGFSGAPMHDPLAAAIAIDPDIGEYEKICLDVETKGPRRGKVVLKNGKPNVLFCKKVNTEKFFKLFISSLLTVARNK